MSDKCTKCNETLESRKESIKCSECNGGYHLVCCRLGTVENLKKLGSKKSWRCDTCKLETASSQSRSDSDVNDSANVMSILRAIRKDMSDNMEESRVRFTNIESSIRDVKDVMAVLKGQVNNLEEETKSIQAKCQANIDDVHVMKEEIKSLRFELMDLQQHSRRNNLEIKGIPYTPKEDVYLILEKIARELDISFDRQHISVAHRLPKPTAGHSTIIVAFISRSTKEMWFSSARKKRLTTAVLSSHLEPGPIYINSHLTSFNKQLLGRAKGLVKSGKLSAAWATDNQVLVKKQEGDRARRVKVFEDLYQFEK